MYKGSSNASPFACALFTLLLMVCRSPPLPEKAMVQLRSILDGLFYCCRYPADSAHPPGEFSSDVQRAAAKEEHESVLADRKDLLTLFKNIARMSASDAISFVSERLQAVLMNSKSTFQVYMQQIYSLLRSPSVLYNLHLEMAVKLWHHLSNTYLPVQRCLGVARCQYCVHNVPLLSCRRVPA